MALSAALRANPVTVTSSGVRVSCRPLSSPCAARQTSIAGMPRALIRRYVTPASTTSGALVIARTASGAAANVAAASGMLSANASHTPSRPAPIAPSSSFAPMRRATSAVVA